ncbi:L,D-transpeptidase family protein [Acetatifactor muris]|uniref:Peptidoglycan binding domain protein n=1 Tax=Acetatifactor muris TaxID=879566 RepID=A0A2K4ZPQ4_9FIRM|nr:L,D-transpeptidase family protein [Acetatifactor muris]MCR2050911.1 L,D-transpeptidase family protein [Acetatifactor muris]SOY32461.1 Putative peptidoglycan binding domain protein [Acetatifactor muris]
MKEKKQNKEEKKEEKDSKENAGKVAEEKAGEKVPEKRKKRYIIIALGIAFILLVVAAVVVYCKGAAYYQTHFLPNTSINGIDCSNMEAREAAILLDAPIQNYSLKITGRNYKTGESGALIGEINSENIQLTYGNSEEAVKMLLEQQNAYEWIWAYVGNGQASSLERNIVFDEDILESIVTSWDACKKRNMLKAKDAYISQEPGLDGYYEVVPETVGTELDVNAVIHLAAEGIREKKDSIDLEEQGCYEEAFIRQDDRRLTSVVDKVNRWLSTSITYDWNGTEVILDREKLTEWITMQDGEPVLDEEKVAKFVKEQAAEYDTYGKKKKFVTTLGTELTLSSRNYGWKTDTETETEELIRLIYKGSTGTREPTYSITAMQKGTNDIGNSYVEADLSNQHLYLYQDGNIVLETDFVSGTMVSTYDCVTPEGIFGLTYKTRNAVLKGATYRTPVSYWMPFYGNYGMHDASWRGAFGGQIFMTSGSHGCINLPPDMAGQIYQYVSEGFPVICYYYGGAPYIGIQAPPASETVVPEEGGEQGAGEEGPAEQPPAETPVEQPPAEAPVETPVEQPPAEAPVETPVEQPPAEAPVETPAEQPPAETPVETPAEQPSAEATVE